MENFVSSSLSISRRTRSMVDRGGGVRFVEVFSREIAREIHKRSRATLYLVTVARIFAISQLRARCTRTWPERRAVKSLRSRFGLSELSNRNTRRSRRTVNARIRSPRRTHSSLAGTRDPSPRPSAESFPIRANSFLDNTRTDSPFAIRSPSGSILSTLETYRSYRSLRSLALRFRSR